MRLPFDVLVHEEVDDAVNCAAVFAPLVNLAQRNAENQSELDRLAQSDRSRNRDLWFGLPIQILV